uniref:50S ribosomal protein L9, chloroplastic n=1 Tax=Polysiphonia sp. TaxID=1967842 RepID=A0A1Z1M3L9_9FLOR|nr:ribosomal protein L9 [Polysiphonia sp.]
MKKKVNIILLKNNIEKYKQGTIISVARGYAFNYLIPNKIAEIATSKKIKHINMFQDLKIKEKKANEIEITLLKNSIEIIKRISIYKKKGDHNSIFGSVTEKDIIQWIDKYTNLKINKTQIKILDTKLIGMGYVKIQINHKIIINLKLHIIPTNI